MLRRCLVLLKEAELLALLFELERKLFLNLELLFSVHVLEFFDFLLNLLLLSLKLLNLLTHLLLLLL